MSESVRYVRVCSIVLAVMWTGCMRAMPASGKEPAGGKEPAMSYPVQRIKSGENAVAWSDDLWRGIEPLELSRFMGDKPAHFPLVQAKVAYDDEAIYVAFRVDDRYVRSVAKKHQESVCNDSCVEFFFTPNENVSAGYFNLEMNCGGTMLLHFQSKSPKSHSQIAPEDLARIEVIHDLPKIVEPEIDKPTRWTVAYRLPLDLLEKYFPEEVARPAAGVVWRANVYKCADATSHPHWLTWSPVGRPRPDFHRPEWFGTFVFE